MLNLTDGCVAAVDHEGDVAYGFADAFTPAAEDRGAAGEGFDVAGGNPVGMRGLAEIVVGVREVDGGSGVCYARRRWKRVYEISRRLVGIGERCGVHGDVR